MHVLSFSNGDTMPILGLGTWKSQPGEVYDAVIHALKVGYRHLDCAYIYKNEDEIGQALAHAFKENIVKREELWVTSKLWNDMHAPEDTETAIKKTLADLQLDYLDLYLIHWPVAHKKGFDVPDDGSGFITLDELPVTETWKGMEALKERGLAKHIGVSNFNIPKIQSILDGCKHQPEVNQVELHPYLAQNDLVAFCQKNSIQMTAYSPLGSGATSENGTPVVLEDPAVTSIASGFGATPAQVALAWNIHREVSVIPKSTNPGRIEENLKAAKVKLGTADMDKLNALDKDYRYIDGTFWTKGDSPYTLEGLWKS